MGVREPGVVTALLLALALLLSQWLWMANARIAHLQALLSEQRRIEKIEKDLADVKGLMEGVALGAGIKKQIDAKF